MAEMEDYIWTLEHAIEIARLGANDGYRAYNGSGGLWGGADRGPADAHFEDWGLARATAIILNAAIEGRLVPGKKAHGRSRRAAA